MKQKIYQLLMVTYRSLLKKCYQQVFFSDSDLSVAKTFDDYLTDFFIYLYDSKPKYIKDDNIKGYYLQQIKDEKAIPAWIYNTFKHFLLDENKIILEMRKSLAEYRKQLTTAQPGETLDITLTHMGFAIAWFNQYESNEDRYLFFRSAYKHFMGFYSWSNDELDDKDIASVLEISPGTLRTRTSRLCSKVKKLVLEVNDALIATLNKESLETAREIYSNPEPDIESILRKLLDQSERELEQYELIVKLRKDKRASCNIIGKLLSKSCGNFEAHISDDDEERQSSIENASNSKRSGHKDIFYNMVSLKSLKTSEDKSVIKKFQSFIGLNYKNDENYDDWE